MTDRPDLCWGCGESHSGCKCHEPVQVSGPTAGSKCPECGAPVRWIDKGNWKKFMGCSRYPKCKWHQSKKTKKPL